MKLLYLALPAAGAAALLLTLVGALWLFVRRKRSSNLTAIHLDNMTIDLDALPLTSLPKGSVSLDVYGVPTHLAVLVLAPVGRGHDLPDKEQWRTLLEQLCPGFGRILDEHQPVFRRWPPQISSHGFNRAFFGNMRTEAQPLQSRRWYKVAGRIDWFNRQILIGLVARADSMTPLAPVEIDHPGKWREVLRTGAVE